jgi:hypothetical protein
MIKMYARTIALDIQQMHVNHVYNVISILVRLS